MNVGECDELASWFQHAHHFVQDFHLHRFRKCSPWQARDNAICHFNSGTRANGSGIGDGVLKQLDVRMLNSEQIGKMRVDFDGDESGAVTE